MDTQTMLRFLLDAGVHPSGIAQLLKIYSDMSKMGPVSIKIDEV